MWRASNTTTTLPERQAIDCGQSQADKNRPQGEDQLPEARQEKGRQAMPDLRQIHGVSHGAKPQGNPPEAAGYRAVR